MLQLRPTSHWALLPPKDFLSNEICFSLLAGQITENCVSQPLKRLFLPLCKSSIVSQMMTLNYCCLLIIPLTIIVDAKAVDAMRQNTFMIDHVASTILTRTTPYQHQQTFGIQARDIPTSTIDFASIPTCALTECIYPASSATPLPCSSIPAPCPSGVGTGCSTFDKSCYCNLATPLECAFHPCPWVDVMLMENWFNQTCPDVDPSISYSFHTNSAEVFVPSCAGNCIHEQVISYGCTSESKNCFCSHASLFGCTATCSKADNSTIASWFAATCQVTAEVATDTVSHDQLDDSEAKSGGPVPPQRPKPLSWYEKLGVAVFSITVGVLLIVAVLNEWLEKCSYFAGHSFSSQHPWCARVAKRLGVKAAPEQKP